MIIAVPRGPTKPRVPVKKISCLGLVVFLAFTGAALSAKGPETSVSSKAEKTKPQTDSTGKQTSESGPVADLNKARDLMEKYEKNLPRAGASRARALTELARLCYILGEWGDRTGPGPKPHLL